MNKRLKDKICVVTGATRGIGRGTAIALAEEGATVYVTGRTETGPLSIESSVKSINEVGGEGHGVVVDHSIDAEIENLFKRIGQEQGKIDILVNNVFKIPDEPVWAGGFWEHPIQVWDDQVGVGLRAHYVASWHAAPLIFNSGSGGLIMNISSPGGISYHFSSSYGTGKAGLDRLTADMAVELKEKEVNTISLYPGAVSTEFVLENAAKMGNPVENAQTPLLVGRSVVALAVAEDLSERSGSIQWVEDISKEFDIRDEYGNLAAPYPIRD
ncbi:MAG: SDR family NAD(P)-dependent oxidoreductase [SAR86 cluster bacterium]|nr:SDR family NAD(P)-dependent oxidoreductase [SAR86 cluster bacterium]